MLKVTMQKPVTDLQYPYGSCGGKTNKDNRFTAARMPTTSEMGPRIVPCLACLRAHQSINRLQPTSTDIVAMPAKVMYCAKLVDFEK